MSNYLNLCKELFSPLGGTQSKTAFPPQSGEKSLPSLTLLAIQTIVLWRHRYQQRKQLAKLDQHLIEDIGLTEKQIREESRKPFWVE